MVNVISKNDIAVIVEILTIIQQMKHSKNSNGWQVFQNARNSAITYV